MEKIIFQPPSDYAYQTKVQITIGHINYGGHVGNSAYLDIAHEARIRFFHSLGMTERQFGGVGLIIRDASIIFKGEVFHQQTLHVSITPASISTVGFVLFYEYAIDEGEERKIVTLLRTGMVCFDYDKRRIAQMPKQVEEKLLEITSK